MDLTKVFDKYHLFARVYPFLLLLLPSVFTILAFSPDLLGSGPLGILLSLAVFSGILYLLSNAARATGKRLESRLIKKWGGYPTTLMLRHSDPSLSEVTKHRYHRFLGTHVPNLGRLPTAAQEQQDSTYADERYESAVSWLKEQRRDEKKYPIVIKELTEYGFRRNLASLRTVGFIIYAASVILCIMQFLMEYDKLFRSDFWLFLTLVLTKSSFMAGAALLNILALCCAWLFNDRWVDEAARTYARSLLSSCDAP